MKAEWVEAERIEEVRAAAAGWRKAGAVNSLTFEEISRRYPEPRTLPAWLWRVLLFILVSIVLLLFAGAFLAATSPSIRNAWVLCAFLGTAFLGVAELQARSRALALRGGVGAAGFWGVVSLLLALFLLLEESLHTGEAVALNACLLGAVLLFALAAWRWGVPVFAAFAAAAGFVLLGRVPFGRFLWIAIGVLVVALAERFLDRPSWAPSHRTSAAAIALVAMAAVYGAANLWSLDHRTVETLRGSVRDWPAPFPLERGAAVAATALLPTLALVIGIRARRRLFLDAGLVAFALSLVTLRAYIHIANLWVVLSGAGALLVLISLALHRWLERGEEEERRGFTAAPLFSDETAFRAVELVPVLAAHAPAAKPVEEAGFTGGGGSFGGGGAGGSF